MIASTLATNALVAVGDMVTISVRGYAGCGMRLSGTFTGTITFEGSTDGVTFGTLTVTLLDATTATTATAAGQWIRNCLGLSVVRMRMTAYTSGTADGQITVMG